MSTAHGTSINPPVVVGVDGSPGGLQATRWAAHHAALTNAPLHLVAAFGWPANTHHDHPHDAAGDSTHHTGSYRDVLLGMRTDHLDEAALVARQAQPGVAVSHEVLVGHPIPVLCGAAQHAEMLVVGSRGLGGVMGLMLGSTAIGIVARAGCPVVVVRDDENVAHTDRPVVVGVDETPASESAPEFAFAEASLQRAPLVVTHLVRFEPGLLPVSDAAVDTALDAAGDRLGERIARWVDKYPDVVVRTATERAHAASGLIELSRSAQLVVVGTRGRGGFAGQLLGSVSQAVLHHSCCPVAVVRTEP